MYRITVSETELESDTVHEACYEAEYVNLGDGLWFQKNRLAPMTHVQLNDKTRVKVERI